MPSRLRARAAHSAKASTQPSQSRNKLFAGNRPLQPLRSAFATRSRLVVCLQRVHTPRLILQDDRKWCQCYDNIPLGCLQETLGEVRHLERRLPVNGLERGPGCHPERSEGSGSTDAEILRCAQDDSHSLQMSALALKSLTERGKFGMMIKQSFELTIC